MRAFEGSLLGNLVKSSLKALTANSDYSSILARKQNLFGITERADNIRLKALSKGIDSLPRRNPEELAQVLFKFYQLFLSWRHLHPFYGPLVSQQYFSDIFLWECMSEFVWSYLALVFEWIKSIMFRISKYVCSFKATGKRCFGS